MDGESETFIAHTLRAEGHDASEDGTGRGVPLVFEPGNLTRPCGANPSPNVVPTLGAAKTGDTFPHISFTSGVRRLTPRECERLQGFPDDYTLVTYHGKPAADGPRYRALGNSMAVPVMAWLGRRIAEVDAI
jgi:DNA (cytosine-5)-methyltransferase 1